MRNSLKNIVYTCKFKINYSKGEKDIFPTSQVNNNNVKIWLHIFFLKQKYYWSYNYIYYLRARGYDYEIKKVSKYFHNVSIDLESRIDILAIYLDDFCKFSIPLVKKTNNVNICIF